MHARTRTHIHAHRHSHRHRHRHTRIYTSFITLANSLVIEIIFHLRIVFLSGPCPQVILVTSTQPNYYYNYYHY